jgi:hypothetical protein
LCGRLGETANEHVCTRIGAYIVRTSLDADGGEAKKSVVRKVLEAAIAAVTEEHDLDHDATGGVGVGGGELRLAFWLELAASECWNERARATTERAGTKEGRGPNMGGGCAYILDLVRNAA